MGGLVADLKYQDREDGTDFTGLQARGYRNSLEVAPCPRPGQVLRRAVADWSSRPGLLLVAQLGDLLDGGNSPGARDGGQAEQALASVQAVLEHASCTDIVSVIGNHELYNFSRARLEKLLGVCRGGGTAWHSFKPMQVGSGWPRLPAQRF